MIKFDHFQNGFSGLLLVGQMANLFIYFQFIFFLNCIIINIFIFILLL